MSDSSITINQPAQKPGVRLDFAVMERDLGMLARRVMMIESTLSQAMQNLETLFQYVQQGFGQLAAVGQPTPPPEEQESKPAEEVSPPAAS